jgi:hypothetical protein
MFLLAHESRSATLAAHTRKMSRAGGGRLHSCCRPNSTLLIPPCHYTGISHFHVFSANKNLIFLQDTNNNFSFLVDSSVSLSIFPYSAMALPTDPHLVWANGKTIPARGFRRFTICFSEQNFKFHFLLTAVITPLLSMDFIRHFSLVPRSNSPWAFPLHLVPKKDGSWCPWATTATPTL